MPKGTRRSVNGRSPKASSLAAPSVYDQLKAEILDRHLKPGVKLTHQGLAEMLGVSRTPVREALERLFQEGYVIRIPRRGFFVAEIGVDEVIHLYQTREALEIYQIEHLVEKGLSRREFAELKAINAHYGKLIDANLTYERLRVDRDFHVRLASLTGNAYLVASLEAVFEKVILKRRLEGVSDPTGRGPYEDHLRLLDALEKGDGAAISILRAHIRGACDRLILHLQSFEIPGGRRDSGLSPGKRASTR